jgi:hypothetical protein
MCTEGACNGSTTGSSALDFAANATTNSNMLLNSDITPVVVVEVVVFSVLLLAVLAQHWRSRRYDRYNLIKKLQVRFFRSRAFNQEVRSCSPPAVSAPRVH